MSNMWRPGRGVVIEDIGDRVILFRFGHEFDLRRVMESGPYSFDQNLLVLREMQQEDNPKEVELHKVDFLGCLFNLLDLGFLGCSGVKVLVNNSAFGS
ncbi:hypothetical protein LINPERPRIM_LOCUS24453 [Linum perenne]